MAENTHSLDDLLRSAVKKGDVDLANQYIQAGANINKTKDKITNLLIAVISSNQKMVKFLLEKGAEPNNKPNWTVISPFNLAISGKNTEIIKDLLSAGADINKINYDTEETALSQSIEDIQKGKGTALFKFLLENGADPNIPNGIGLTPLRLAIATKNTEIIKDLLIAGVDINQLDIDDHTALYAATLSKENKLFHFFLENGADPNKPTGYGQTPLQAALDIKNTEKILYLLLAGAKPPKDHKSELLTKMQNEVNILQGVAVLTAIRPESEMYGNVYDHLDAQSIKDLYDYARKRGGKKRRKTIRRRKTANSRKH